MAGTSARRCAVLSVVGSFLIVSVALPAPAPVTVTLAARGRATSTIVIAHDAPAGVQQAAAELSGYVARMAGCAKPLPIRALSSPLATPGEAYVFVGNVSWALHETSFKHSQLPAEGYSVFAHNSSWLFIVGKNDTEPVGDGTFHSEFGMAVLGYNDTLAATYDLLGQLGVRWLWPSSTGEVVPSVPIIKAPPAGHNVSSAPKLIKRHLRPIYHDFAMWTAVSGNLAEDSGLSTWLNHSVFEQLAADEALWLQRMRMGSHEVPPWGQAFMTWWAQYNETHPEYFALQPDGHRGPVIASEPDRVKMCVSNPALHREIAAGGTSHNAYGLSAAEDDSNTGYCTCSKCSGWDAAGVAPWNSPGASLTGSLSDRYARFFDAVYSELAKTTPEAWVTAYAYEQYRDPPVNYTIRGNVMMGYVGFGYPSLPTELEENKQHWGGWFSAGAKRLFWRPNCLIAGDGMPYMFGTAIAKDFGWLAGHGLAATDFDSLMGHWASAGSTYYATARMHWAPEQTEPALVLEEWFAGFGPARAEVQAYVRFWENFTFVTFTSNATRNRIENLTRSISSRAGVSHGWYKNIAYVYNGNVLDQADRMLETAQQACRADMVCAERIIFLSHGAKHGRLVAEALNATKAAGENIPGRGLGQSGLRKAMQAASKLTKFRTEIATSGAVNVMWAQYNEVKLGDYTSVGLTADAARTIPDAYKPLLLTPNTYWIFALDEDDKGISEHWYNASWRAAGNWSRVGTMQGWGGATAWREWSASHPKETYTGAGWFRHTFSGEDLEERQLPDSLVLAMSAVCGSMRGWINGFPITAPSPSVSPDAPLLLQLPRGAVKLSGPNILALRFQDKGGSKCKPPQEAGLRGRVYIVGK